jgi:hypothetical protein
MTKVVIFTNPSHYTQGKGALLTFAAELGSNGTGLDTSVQKMSLAVLEIEA